MGAIKLSDGLSTAAASVSSLAVESAFFDSKYRIDCRNPPALKSSEAWAAQQLDALLRQTLRSPSVN